MRTLIINSANLVQNGFNDTYQYKFPQGSVRFDNDTVALASISMYFSWDNITSATSGSQYNNNTFQYLWTDGTGTSLHTVVLPDGYYEYSTMNEFLQYTMVQNGHYLIDSAGNYVYYLEIVANQTYFAVQLNSYPLPTALPPLWTNPAGIVFPALASTPQFVILPTNNFQLTLGFNAGTYPPAIQATNYSVLSQNTPQITPVQSLILQCTLLNNQYALPSTLLYSFNPAGTPFGALITVQPPSFAFVDIQDGAYSDFTISFKDQNLNRIFIKDPNIVVLMVIMKKEGYLLK